MASTLEYRIMRNRPGPGCDSGYGGAFGDAWEGAGVDGGFGGFGAGEGFDGGFGATDDRRGDLSVADDPFTVLHLLRRPDPLMAPPSVRLVSAPDEPPVDGMRPILQGEPDGPDAPPIPGCPRIALTCDLPRLRGVLF